jgi:hypothetical protein
MKRLPSTDLGQPAFAKLQALPAISALLQQARDHTQLAHRLEVLLPAELVKHVRFAKLEAGKLHFVADTSAWAAKLRLLSYAVLRDAQKLGLDNVHTLIVSVQRAL